MEPSVLSPGLVASKAMKVINVYPARRLIRGAWQGVIVSVPGVDIRQERDHRSGHRYGACDSPDPLLGWPHSNPANLRTGVVPNRDNRGGGAPKRGGAPTTDAHGNPAACNDSAWTVPAALEHIHGSGGPFSSERSARVGKRSRKAAPEETALLLLLILARASLRDRRTWL